MLFFTVDLPEESETVDWYVRGDEKGEYYLKAALRAVSMPYGDLLEEEFVTDKPIRVYAGDQMHMTITVPDRMAVKRTPILSRMIPAIMRKKTNTLRNGSEPAKCP